MPWSSGHPDAGASVFNSQVNLVLTLLTHLSDERLSQPGPASGIKPWTGSLAAQGANHCSTRLQMPNTPLNINKSNQS